MRVATGSGVRVGLRAFVRGRLAVYFVATSTYQTFWAVWLLGRGFETPDIGLAVAVSLTARAASVAVVFPLLNQRWDLLQIARTVPWLVVAAALPFVAVQGLWSLLAVSAVFGLLFSLMLPLHESLATLAAREGLLRYGPTRAFGSIGFITGTVAVGWLISARGPSVIVTTLIAMCLVMALLGAVRPRESAVVKVRGTGRTGLLALLTDRSFVLCLMACVLVQSSHATIFTFGALRAQSLVPPIGVPFLLVISSVSALVLFCLAGEVVERTGPRTLLALGAVCAVVRWSMLAVSSTWQVFACSQLLHAGSYALTHLAFALLVRDRLRPEHQALAHGLYAAFAVSLGSAGLTALAGPLVATSFSLAFWVMAATAALALLPVAALPRRRVAA